MASVRESGADFVSMFFIMEFDRPHIQRGSRTDWSFSNFIYHDFTRRIRIGKTYKRIEISESRYKWHQSDNFVVVAKLISL